jgi:hypothetical protein
MKTYTLPETLEVKGVTVQLSNMDCVAITQLVYEALAHRLNTNLERVVRAEAALEKAQEQLGKTVADLEAGQLKYCMF